MSFLKQMREEGNTHFAAGRYDEAAKCFRSVVDKFTDEQNNRLDWVEEFVKVAGNLCICLRQQGELDACFRTAREVVATYPIIPKALGAMGMCIMDRLVEQEQEALVAAKKMSDADGKHSGELRRRDPSRYVTEIGGLLCTADDAHVYLCRAVVLSSQQLQVSLGPHLQLAVRWISEQLVSASYGFMSEQGTDAAMPPLLERACPLVQYPDPTSPLLATARAEIQTQLKQFSMQDGMCRNISGDTGRAMLAEIEAAQREQGEEAEAEPLLEITDFALSDKPIAVRVCKSERGGLPRGVHLTPSVVKPFAVGPWVSTDVEQPRVVEIPDASELPAMDANTAMEISSSMLMGGGAVQRTDTCCAACGKSVDGMACIPGCDHCLSVRYCSEACEAAYGDRHRSYECALRQELERRLQLELELANSAQVPNHNQVTRDASNEIPGSGWSLQHLHHGVLPLCIAVWSGVLAKAEGWERVVTQLQRGVTRRLLSAIPAAVRGTAKELAALLPEPTSVAELSKMSAEDIFIGLLLLCRLYVVNRGDGHDCSLLYTELLLFRHSCEPNCTWSSDLRTVITNRFVHKGEELTLCVQPDTFPQHWPWQVREKWLVCHQGFYCQCARCNREQAELNTARGNLSNDLTEQLLCADVLLRDRKSIPHATHHFHMPVQQAVHQATSAAARGPEDAAEGLRKLVSLRTELAAHLLPTHYLFEDLRRAAVQIAVALGDDEAHTREAHCSLLFFECLWAGSIPAKQHIMRMLPPPPAGTRRRVQNRQLRRRAPRNVPSPTGDGSTSTPTAAAAARPTSAEKPERDFSEGTVIDLFLGSYQSWNL